MKRLVILLLFVFMIFRPINVKADEFVPELQAETGNKRK